MPPGYANDGGIATSSLQQVVCNGAISRYSHNSKLVSSDKKNVLRTDLLLKTSSATRRVARNFIRAGENIK